MEGCGPLWRIEGTVLEDTALYIYSILVTYSHILLSKKVSEITKDTKDTSLIYIHFYHIFDTFQQYLPQLCISLSH